jgi:endo-1,4-beta-D-glucanase Y
MLVSERSKSLVPARRPQLGQDQGPQPPRRRHRRLGMVLVGAALLGAALAAVLLQSPHRQQRVPTDGSAKAAARSFLNRYVDADGRVVRHDQGGDTVSEGQAYALLLAQAAGDPATFDRVWTWTRSHLQEPGGLFAFRTNAIGSVVDPQPASDADVLIAWALIRTNGPRAAEYHRAGLQVAQAVLARETVRRGDTLMLAAGPWATGQPVTLDPSYWAPAAFEQLATATHDLRWTALDDGTVNLSTKLTSGGRALPPDWARVDRTVPVPTEAPNGQSHFVQYGLDAQRLVVWLATSCNPSARQLAARLDPLLSAREDALALSPLGQVIDQQTNATPVVAAAAAAQAAGRIDRRESLLARAAAENSQTPTYYGSAWVALGRTLLTTHLLGGCPEVGS